MNSLSHQSRTIAWAMWAVASLFYAYQYILRVMPNIMLNDIMQQFGITEALFGQFSGVYYIGYSLMHLPLGIMLDRFGPRKVMTVSILLTVVGLMPLLMSGHWFYPIVGRLLIGLGSSAAILGVFKIIRLSFSESCFPRMLSFSVTVGLMGAIYGGGPVSYMREIFGYFSVIQLFAITGIVLACVTYWVIPEMSTPAETTVTSDIKEVLSNHRVILCCLFAGAMVGPLEGFADVWATAFLKQVYGFEGTLAASLPSTIFIGMCFGAPLLSLIAEKMGNYLATIIAAGVTMAITFSFLLTYQLSSSGLTASFVVLGICCAYQILAIYQASTYVRPEVAGLTTAVANMIIMVFGYLFHAVIGHVISAAGGANTPEALQSGVIVIPIALLIGSTGFTYLLLERKKISVQSA